MEKELLGHISKEVFQSVSGDTTVMNNAKIHHYIVNEHLRLYNSGKKSICCVHRKESCGIHGF